MSESLLIDLHFLPSLEYMCVLSAYTHVTLEKHEHYVKQSYRNRCYINTTQGVQMLSVPLTNKHGKISVSDVLIDYSARWQNNLWRTVESAYRNSPYYEHYCDDLKKIIYSGTPGIFELNKKLLSFCLNATGLSPILSETSDYKKVTDGSFSDMRSAIPARNTYIERNFYRAVPYYQVFGNGFEENLSIVDLLFCVGPDAAAVIRQSRSLPR